MKYLDTYFQCCKTFLILKYSKCLLNNFVTCDMRMKGFLFSFISFAIFDSQCVNNYQKHKKSYGFLVKNEKKQI